jgi:hypothetical protein
MRRAADELITFGLFSDPMGAKSVHNLITNLAVVILLLFALFVAGFGFVSIFVI